jgi:hypothetical protein
MVRFELCVVKVSCVVASFLSIMGHVVSWPLQLDDQTSNALSSLETLRSERLLWTDTDCPQVPWLPLHGIQFRRVGGDGWQYQMLAKTILREMRL